MKPVSDTDPLLLKLTAGSAILAGPLFLIGNFLHPSPSELGMEPYLRMVADHDGWLAVHQLNVLAAILTVAGLFGVSQSVAEKWKGGLARLAFGLAVAGATILSIDMAIDGYPQRQFALRWAQIPAGERAAALNGAYFTFQSNWGLLTTAIFLFFGLPFLLYGLAILRTQVFPRGLGWLAALAGSAAMVAGPSLQFTGNETGQPIAWAMLGVSGLAFFAEVVWLVAVGVLLWRKASPN